MTTRRYSELCRYETFEDRFDYLRIGGSVGRDTFGFDRYINQAFYASREWKLVRQAVIVRDDGCDLGHLDYPISGSVLVHHINPMTAMDIEHGAEMILDPENLISTSPNTHNAIHFGDHKLLPKPFVARAPGDTRLW